MTSALGLGGLLLNLSHFDVHLPEQPPAVLERMLWVYLLLPLALWSGAILFIWCYPLSRSKMQACRSALEARRAPL